MSEDPMGFGAGDVNLDRYVGNNPTDAVDPMGLQSGGQWVVPPSSPGMAHAQAAARPDNPATEEGALAILNRQIRQWVAVHGQMPM
jgi:hypothetical protein